MRAPHIALKRALRLLYATTRLITLSLSLLSLLSCERATEPSSEAAQGDPCEHRGTPAATSTCLTPTQTEAHYLEQALLYFDTLDVTTPESNLPTYHEQVARWEWPPWLLLTGFGAQDMINTGLFLREFDPSTVPVRDCRVFPTQPFARCYIDFEYEGGRCPIYEEFTFNDEGEMTFIEAWSHDPAEPFMGEGRSWGERDDFPRLSTRVPGLGTPSGPIPYDDPELLRRAEERADEQVLDYLARITDWRRFWLQTLRDADRDFFAIGCGWD